MWLRISVRSWSTVSPSSLAASCSEYCVLFVLLADVAKFMILWHSKGAPARPNRAENLDEILVSPTDFRTKEQLPEIGRDLERVVEAIGEIGNRYRERELDELVVVEILLQFLERTGPQSSSAARYPFGI
jgi:hypothetical protein